MNIVEFVSKFDDVIPYSFNLSIGGARKNDIKINKELISYDNFKGKMIPYYDNVLGKTEIKYVPVNEISLPIDIKVKCDGLVLFDDDKTHSQVKDNPIKRTKKDGTYHIIRLINKEGKQYGCIQLSLNSAGDIISKTCTYNNSEFTHEIMHTVRFEYNGNREIIRSEDTTYTEKNYDTNAETVVELYQQDGMITGIKIIKRRLQSREDILFQSITDLTKSITDEDTNYYLVRTECSSYQDAISKYRRMSWENFIIKRDLTEFRKRKEYLDSQKDNPKLIPFYTNERELEYYANEKNDLFYGFIGEYTGNTFVRKGDKLALIVRTSDKNFNYYTEIDLTGTDPFIGTNPCDMDDEVRDFKYYERIKDYSKIPKFKTKIINGEECLVPKNGNICTEEEIKEFDNFKGFYLEPFEQINKLKTSKLLQKKK